VVGFNEKRPLPNRIYALSPSPPCLYVRRATHVRKMAAVN